MSTTAPEKLSIVIPVCNERYTIATLIERVLAAPLPSGMEREIVVVDDGSTDGTREVLEELAKQYDHTLRLDFHAKNKGKGATIRTALEKTTGSICLVQDADLEYDPNDYCALVEPILAGDADAVFGSRFTGRGRRRVLYFWHAVGNRLLTGLSNLFTDLNLTDMETCYKAVRSDVLRSIPLRCNRFGIEPELTAKLAKRDCRIYEVPISYHGRSYSEGKKVTWWDGVKALCVIVYFWLVDDIYKGKYGHAILYRLSKSQRFNRWMADTIRPWMGDKVLEIGSGLGNLTSHLLPREQYTVSDIDSFHLDFLRNHFGRRPHVNIAEVNLEKRESFESLGRKYDTIICLNVLEHVEEDVEALHNIYDSLLPGGRAIILVPRGQWLFGTMDVVLEHRRRYSAGELKEKFVKAGFRVEKLFGFNKVSVFPWYFNGKILRRRHFGKVQLKIFDSLVWLWKRIDRFFPWPGLSLIVVAQKLADSEGPT